MVSATYIDLTNLVQRFEYAEANIETGVQNYLETTGHLMADDMRNTAPRDTGYLANSIEVLTERLKVTVGPRAYYAAFVEDGTHGPYVIKPVQASSLVFTVNGRKVFAKKVIHPGNKPNPFVRPAAIRYLDSLGQDVAGIGVQMIGGKQ